jgi:RNA polymerase sigma factor (TIGR02999 family)
MFFQNGPAPPFCPSHPSTKIEQRAHLDDIRLCLSDDGLQCSCSLQTFVPIQTNLSTRDGRGLPHAFFDIRYPPMTDVTQLLNAIDDGDPNAAAQLLPLVYDELRRLAAARLASEPSGNTLQPTALVHEAYLRLVGTPNGDGEQWDHRGHFFAAAAEAMRRVLIDQARRKATVRHGGAMERQALEPDIIAVPAPREDLFALDEALDKLAAEDPVKADLVKLRYFVGMSLAEAAAALGLSERTAGRHWTYARAWLRRAIENPKK